LAAGRGKGSRNLPFFRSFCLRHKTEKFLLLCFAPAGGYAAKKGRNYHGRYKSARASQRYFSLTTNQPPATSRNQPAVLFSQNKPAPAIIHQPTEHAARWQSPRPQWG
jgi:hypothetical protein